MPPRGLFDRAFAARQDCFLRFRPEPRPDPGGDRQLRRGGARHEPRRSLPRRGARRPGGRPRSRVPGRAGRRRHAQAGIQGAGRAQPRARRGDRLDLRPLLRLRENKRRVSDLSKELEQILARLGELLPPPPPSTDWSESVAYRWRSSQRRGNAGRLQAVRQIHRIRPADLRGIDKQIEQAGQNKKQFLNGEPGNNVLLTGARGTGKSSIVKGLLNKYSKQGLRLIEVEKNDLVDLPQIVDQVAGRKERFIVFCDDLSFHGAEDGYIALKVALDGSISTTSENMLIYATSNRRHLMPEHMAENLETKYVGDEIHPGETVEEKISLSERFGLWVTFYPFDQDEYLDIVGQWLKSLGAKMTDQAREESLQWSLQRGSRSGRVAYQFARDWAGRHSKT